MSPPPPMDIILLALNVAHVARDTRVEGVQVPGGEGVTPSDVWNRMSSRIS